MSRSIPRLLSKSHVFLLLAFTVPLLFRAIPEILMGSHLVGFDTMGHYVPTTLLWLRGDTPFLTLVGTAPLLYCLIISLVSLGGPIIEVIKAISIVLEGFLGLSIFGFAKIGLGWSPKKSVATALLGTLYFVALRVSMDSLRNMLGLIFFFAVLTFVSLIQQRNSRKNYVLLSLSMVGVVMSHQLVSIIMFAVLAFIIVYMYLKNEKGRAIRLSLAYLLPAILFLAVLFSFSSVSEFRLIFGFSYSNDGWLSMFGFSSYPAMLLSEAGFFAYCFLPILPFMLLGIWRLKNLPIRIWILVCLILLLVPLASPSNLRWILMLTYPLTFCAIEALSTLKFAKLRHSTLNLRQISTIYVVLVVSILSIGFIAMPPEQPFPYFAEPANSYIYQIPTSMQQNTVPKNDCSDTVNALEWYKNNVNTSALLLTHRAFYGWAILSLDTNQPVLYEYDDPENTAISLSQQGNKEIFLIWWIDGQGWYGQPSAPSSFEELYRSGNIAIYSYQTHIDQISA